MSVLTHKMKSARTDHYGDNLKLWFPCNEGSGDTITDRILGVALDDAATSEHDIPHTIGMGTASNVAGTGIAAIKVPKKGMFIVVVHPGSVIALVNIVLGNSTTTALSIAGAGVSFKVAGQTAVNGVTGASAATDAVIAIAWDEANLYTYYGEDADAALVDTDALPAAVVNTLPISLADAMTINGSATPSDMYGLALFDFTNDGLPSDLLTGINWMKDHWTAGDKVIYPEWVSRS